MKHLLIVSILVALAGCTAVQNIAEDYKYTSALRYFVSDEDKQARYEKICSDIGLKAEDENWIPCLMKARELDEARANARTSSSNSSRAALPPVNPQTPGCAATNTCF